VRWWDLTQIEAPDGTRDPVVLATENGARAVVIALSPGQGLGDHEVTERAWISVVEGSVHVSTGAEDRECGAGTLMTFEPHERRAIRSDGGARILMLLAPWPGEDHFRSHDRSA
jgi:quercetin dioxygenase-like cupin family protein